MGDDTQKRSREDIQAEMKSFNEILIEYRNEREAFDELIDEQKQELKELQKELDDA